MAVPVAAQVRAPDESEYELDTLGPSTTVLQIKRKSTSKCLLTGP